MSKEKHYCIVSGKEIPEARVEALKMLGTPESQWTCVEHSMARPKQGIFMGEAGTSEMRLVNKVYNDSVRSVFKSSDKEVTKTADDGPDNAPQEDNYSSTEMSYYAAGGDSQEEAENIPVLKKLDS